MKSMLGLGIMMVLATSSLGQVAAMDRSIEKEVVVEGSIKEVWDAWTTNEGAHTFFSPYTNISAELGAPYEIYFGADQPYGRKGSEGCQVQAIVPHKLFAFTWNAPPQFPTIREPELHTVVYLRFEELGPKKTKVRFSQRGWGEGGEWDQVYAYFEKAWDIVLGRLKLRFANGPLDWANAPVPTESLAVAKK